MKLSNAGRRKPTGGAYAPTSPMSPPGGGNPMRPSGSSTLNVVLIIVSAILGVFAWFIGRAIYAVLGGKGAGIVVIGLIFFVLTMILVIGVFVVSHFSGAFEGNEGSTIGIMVAGAVGVLAIAAMFQWIYSIDFKEETTGTSSYVFLIDDSGSNETTDPNQLRFQAIEDVLQGEKEDFPYMVYTFSNGTEIVREMKPASTGIEELSGKSEGGTAMRGALTQVIEDYKNQVWEGGACPKVILLTDGYAGDIGFFQPINSVLKEYKKAGISISTVGLDQVDVDLLDRIAKETGGVFINVADASELSGALKSAVVQTQTSRDLLSVRLMSNGLNILYGIMRLIFVTILGIGMGLLVTVAYGNTESFNLILVSSIIKSLIGAVIMEVGTSLMGISDKLAWFILWILIAVTIAIKPSGQNSGGRSERRVQKPSRSANKSSRRIGM